MVIAFSELRNFWKFIAVLFANNQNEKHLEISISYKSNKLWYIQRIEYNTKVKLQYIKMNESPRN